MARLSRLVVFALIGIAMTGIFVPVVPAFAARDEAVHHLQTGVKLFNDGNYAAALVEFEASMTHFPSASALQNIALCQTKLFRYVEALQTLETLKRRYGDTLSAQDLKQITSARENLSQLIATVMIRVSPDHAKVKLDGKIVTPERRKQPIKLSSGEYELEVSADNHVPITRRIKVAGGQQETVDVWLTKAVAQLTVRASDKDAAIAVNRQPAAYGEWKGEVAAGEHLLQVYKKGYETRETIVTLRAGDKAVMQLALGPRDDVEAGDGAATASYDYAGLPYRLAATRRLPFEASSGWYVMLGAATVAPMRSPGGFSPRSAVDPLGGVYGARGGYRVSNFVGFEALAEFGLQSTTGEVRNELAIYDLVSVRMGGAVRGYWGGRRLRATAALSVGGVWHRLAFRGNVFAGFDAFGALEVGPQFNIGNALVEVFATGYLDGVKSLHLGRTTAFPSSSVLPHLGIGIRGGFGGWSDSTSF